VRVATFDEYREYVATKNPGSVIGVDEAGRGCWAGPIVAAAAAVPVGWEPPGALRDSKKMTDKSRFKIYEQFSACDHVVVSVAMVSAQEIDEIGINPAQAKAQAEAIRGLFWRLVYPPFVVVDGNQPPNIGPPDVAHIMCLPKADNLVPAVSLASVFAKETQVREAERMAAKYPDYGFENHRAYGTKEHREALYLYGPCPLHRRSYKPVAAAEALHLQKQQSLI
jgi:ribonuclease HII